MPQNISKLSSLIEHGWDGLRHGRNLAPHGWLLQEGTVVIRNWANGQRAFLADICLGPGLLRAQGSQEERRAFGQLSLRPFEVANSGIEGLNDYFLRRFDFQRAWQATMTEADAASRLFLVVSILGPRMGGFEGKTSITYGQWADLCGVTTRTIERTMRVWKSSLGVSSTDNEPDLYQSPEVIAHLFPPALVNRVSELREILESSKLSEKEIQLLAQQNS